MWVVLLLLLLHQVCNVQGKEYTIVVKTSSSPWDAATDAWVQIKIIGTKGELGPRELNGDFEKGSTDVFHLQDYGIGLVKGMEITRNNGGILPSWHLDEVVIQVADAGDSVFYYNNWVDAGQWTTLTLSCRSGYQINQYGFCSAPCNSGYVIDPENNCLDVNECSLGSDQCDLTTTTCVNTEGSYLCSCKPGYIPGETEHKCTDLNECTYGTHQCDLISTTCDNFEGSYTCSCKPGYQSESAHTCKDVNECSLGSDQCDLTTTTCVNTEGSYLCSCKLGYKPGETAHKCTDVNECSDETHQCDLKISICVNSPGSYACPCRTGYNYESANKCTALVCDPDVSEPLGMESGHISNASITASSYYVNYEPWNARLNAGGDTAWYALPSDTSAWIQVDLGKVTWIKGVATQGKRFTLFVKTFKLAYSHDAVTWFIYSDGDGQTDKVFNANTDPYKAVTNQLAKPVYARYARVYPATYNHGVALRLEPYGCTPP